MPAFLCRLSGVSRGKREVMCVVNRWVQPLGGAAPGGGADCETGRGLSLWFAGGGTASKVPGRQQLRRTGDVVRDRPEVCSGPGSSVE